MAINPNPVDEQMAAITQVGQQPIAPASVGIQAQASTPPGFTPKPQTTAQSILQAEGISSSRQLLQSMKVPSAKEILASAGITSPTDILEKERTKQIGQAKLQEEMDLRQKELDYMKNYKFDVNTFNPTEYETKYGNIDFKNAQIGNGYGFNNHDISYTYQYVIDGEQYLFLPEAVAMQGARGSDNKQVYNYGFLDKNTWAAMNEYGQAIDLSSMDVTKLTPFQVAANERTFGDEQMKAMQSRGYLFKLDDFEKFRSEHLDNKWASWGSLAPVYGTGKNQYGGDIKGISQLRDGSLAYITQPSGGHDQVSTYIDSSGQPWLHWHDKPSGPLADIGNFFNSVPFLAELTLLSPVTAPFYPAIKGSQAHAAGGDLGDVAASVAGGFVATSPVMSNMTSSATGWFEAAGMEAATAKVAGSALVGAGYAGTMAALTGQDVGKALTAGALSGGFSAGTPAIAEAMFGDSVQITKLAESLNMSKAQFQNTVVASLGNASIGAAVYNKDFFEIFSNDLVTKGLSVSAANKVAQTMQANAANPAEIQRAVRGTQLVVQATARSAIRGTDINMELERALRSFAGGEIQSAIKTASK